MNSQYQNTAAEAIHEFEQLAVGSGEPVQLLFPIEEVVTTVRRELGELMRRVGVMFACAVMEEEVERRVGAQSQPNQARNAYRWGTEKGYCIVEGQRIQLPRPQIRSVDGSEIRLGSYELFQKASDGRNRLAENHARSDDAELQRRRQTVRGSWMSAALLTECLSSLSHTGLMEAAAPGSEHFSRSEQKR